MKVIHRFIHIDFMRPVAPSVGIADRLQFRYGVDNCRCSGGLSGQKRIYLVHF